MTIENINHEELDEEVSTTFAAIYAGVTLLICLVLVGVVFLYKN